MELYVYPPIGQGLAWNGVIDQFGSLRWRRKYTEPGEFELHLPASKENVALLRPGVRLQRLDCREQGEISGIRLEGEEMSVTGRMLSARLDQHIQPLFACSCSAAEAMRKAVAAEKPAELEVLVDNQCSVENVTRYGQSQGYKVETAPEGADFRLKLKK